MVSSYAETTAPDPHILRVEEIVDPSADAASGGAESLGDELRYAAEQMIDQQKAKAADAAQGIARVLRQAAEQFAETPAAMIGRYAVQTADNVDRLSDRVREEPLSDLLADAEAAARRQPELFFLGAAAAGFMIGRFLKASADRRRADLADYNAAHAPNE